MRNRELSQMKRLDETKVLVMIEVDKTVFLRENGQELPISQESAKKKYCKGSHIEYLNISYINICMLTMAHER